MTKNNLTYKIRQNREKRAINLAGDILEAAGLLTAPIDLLALVKQESPWLVVKSGNFKDSFDGRLEYHATHDRFILFYNNKYGLNDFIPGAHHQRTRFTIAHELGHFYLDEHRAFLIRKGQAHSSTSEFVADDVIEREADAFAAGLLMPDRLIRPLVNQGELTAKRIKGFATHFNTSCVSATIRSVLVSDFPCAVVAVRNGLITWCFSSNALIEAQCYPLPQGPLKSPSAIKQWQAFSTGHEIEEELCAASNNWFRCYGPVYNTFMVSEYFLPVPKMDMLLILISVSEQDILSFYDEEIDSME
ncbi:MAG: ImmA/IrrE family metallo-endopeptidase [Candidatus Hydrogenedentes bacterium]|nr:ImmA/IrrE family metallo-endopeptidase [Candidatus Hydrogenedentota bacterium]